MIPFEKEKNIKGKSRFNKKIVSIVSYYDDLSIESERFVVTLYRNISPLAKYLL